jgi:AraC-like DNA-binding protein/effector-binding domain-containing protein
MIRSPRRSLKKMQPVLAYAAGHLDEDISLAALSRQTGLSAFHLQRVFSATIGETPKQLTSRLRLEHAATLLLTNDDSILDVALSCGFQSHEVFIRAFRRRFGIIPSAYRARGLTPPVNQAQAKEHAALVKQVGPCIGLYHFNEGGRLEKTEMTYTIARKEISPQPVLVARRRVKRTEIAQAITEALPQVFLFAQQNGIALTGLPLTRYVEWGPGLLTIEPGMRIATPGQGQPPAPGGSSPAQQPIKIDTLPGGPVATTMHAGQYDKLTEAHAAIQQWIESQGFTSAGAPWESYVNSPADYPDPKDWKTEVFWPIAP